MNGTHSGKAFSLPAKGDRRRGWQFWRTRLWLVAGTAICIAAGGARGGGVDRRVIDYQDETDYVPETPSVTGGAVSAFANPAAWATGGLVETAFWWNDRALGEGGLGNWGLSAGRRIGFAAQRQRLSTDTGRHTLYDYQIGLAGGDRRSHVGLAWRWATGAAEALDRENALVLGTIARPSSRVSYGLAVTHSMQSNARAATIDIGIRPLATPLLTVFADYTLRRHDTLEEGRWGAGLVVRPVTGVHLGAKFREVDAVAGGGDGPGGGADDYRFTLSFGVTLDRQAGYVLPTYDEDGHRGATTYLLRTNPPHRGIAASRFLRQKLGPRHYVPVDLENKVLSYQRDRWFDSRRVAWIDLLEHLNAIRDEPSARGVAMNMAGFRCPAVLAWELREKLQELQGAGKEVIIHGDRLGFIDYYLASVADRLTLDPQGYVLLPGLALYRTYYRDALVKLGIGFEEFRFFTHKSALERYSRSTMSEADREQLGRFVDSVYETVAAGVVEGRQISRESFDSAVDEDVVLTAGTAETRGLVDAASRWSELSDWLREERNGARLSGLPERHRRGESPDERWGRPKEIAVVYAVGPCEMDSGIRGRSTSARLRALAEDRDVAAVVLRADSPGGDPLPSDLVAEGIRKLRDAGKPVVVSQGSVAASGGYWISMDGTRILTTPFTITGSIGVIGGWFWDDGLGDKTGVRSDGVQRGAHSDLFTGARYPFAGLVIPRRALTGEEKTRVEMLMREVYDTFVAKVGAARGLDDPEVRRLGEGRVWMGPDAVANGLCDEVGTLEDGIDAARELAGLSPREEFRLSEFPPRKLFSLPPILRRVPGLEGQLPWLGGPWDDAGDLALTEEYSTIYLKSLLSAPGQARLLTPPEFVLSGWNEIDPGWSETGATEPRP